MLASPAGSCAAAAAAASSAPLAIRRHARRRPVVELVGAAGRSGRAKRRIAGAGVERRAGTASILCRAGDGGGAWGQQTNNTDTGGVYSDSFGNANYNNVNYNDGNRSYSAPPQQQQRPQQQQWQPSPPPPSRQQQQQRGAGYGQTVRGGRGGGGGGGYDSWQYETSQQRAMLEAESEARAAREEAQWRAAYARRKDEKREQWNQWDEMAEAENVEREQRSRQRRASRAGSQAILQSREQYHAHSLISGSTSCFVTRHVVGNTSRRVSPNCWNHDAEWRDHAEPRSPP